jgi:hypothetical protein
MIPQLLLVELVELFEVLVFLNAQIEKNDADPNPTTIIMTSHKGTEVFSSFISIR